MVQRGTPFALVLLGVAFLGQGGVRAQDPQPGVTSVPNRFYSARDRLHAIREASLVVPRAVSDSDIVEGPAQRPDQFRLHFNDRVTCEFTLSGEKKSGTTAKFDCRITRVESPDGHVQVPAADMDEEPVKVKFRKDNREIYAEVASTRLLWALGFYADAMFGIPLRHAAPLFGAVHFISEYPRLKTDLYLNFNGAKPFDKMPPSEIEKPYIYAVDKNGNPWSPAWFTLNFKLSYCIARRYTLSGGVENILDNRYRPYSSGIAAPGRNFIFSARIII